MPCIPVLRFSDRQDEARPEAGEVKSGVLEVIRSTRDASAGQRVFVRVYRTSSEHFAVLFPVRALMTACRPLASINLRSCTVDHLPGTGREFRVTPRPCEGVALTFSVPESVMDKDSVSSWMLALTVEEKRERKRTLSDSRKILPVVLENEEENNEES